MKTDCERAKGPCRTTRAENTMAVSDRGGVFWFGEFGRHVPNAELSLNMVPDPTEPAWEQMWSEFALAFDGYRVWGTLARMGAMARRTEVRLRDYGPLAASVTDLRTVLFWAQRAAHWGSEPNLYLVAAVLTAIRAKVARGEVEPEPAPLSATRPLESTQDRVAASLLGLAVGDCLGAGVEGWTAEGIRRAHGTLDHFVYPQTAWTDDTQQALVLAESQLRHGVPNPEWVGRRFVEMRHGGGGRFGLHRGTGSGFRAAISTFERTGDPQHSGNIDRAGNGAAMRIAPVAAAMWELGDEEFDDAIVRVSLLTHREPSAILGALAVARLTADLVSEPAFPVPETRGVWLRRELLRWLDERATWLGQAFGDTIPHADRGFDFNRVLTRAFDVWDNGWEARRAAIEQAASALRGKRTLSTDAFVLASVPTAICLVLGAVTDFRDILIQAVNLGGDADTVGAIVGGMAGAAAGLHAIPAEWRTFAGSEALQAWAHGLAGLVPLEDLPPLRDVEEALCAIVRRH